MIQFFSCNNSRELVQEKIWINFFLEKPKVIVLYLDCVLFMGTSEFFPWRMNIFNRDARCHPCVNTIRTPRLLYRPLRCLLFMNLGGACHIERLESIMVEIISIGELTRQKEIIGWNPDRIKLSFWFIATSCSAEFLMNRYVRQSFE